MSEQAIFAAGCFWGVQFYFDQVPGVIRTTAGYTGGHTENPTYWEVASKMTGHAEAVLIEFNPEKVSYETLVKHFFRLHNPRLLNTDGINNGPEYRSAAYYFDKNQKNILEKYIKLAQQKYKEPIVTEVKEVGKFYKAEAEHQKFTERTGIGMCHVDYAPVGQDQP